MTNKLKVYPAIAAALLLGVAGCSSSASGSASQSTTTPASTTSGTSTSAAVGAPDTSDSTSAAADVSTSSAAASTGGAGGTGGTSRPDDACTLLTSGQVESAVGTDGPFTGAHEDPKDDGTPVWGCTWGTHDSAADIREISAETFESTPDPADVTAKPVSGIGDKARMDTMNPDGRNPDLLFTVGGAYYDLSVMVSRRETGAEYADQEQKAEKALAALLVPKLAS